MSWIWLLALACHQETDTSSQDSSSTVDSGLDSNIDENLPKEKIASITAGGDHTCIIGEGGQVRCWGKGNSGQLGYGNTSNIGDDETPATIGNVHIGELVDQIDANTSHTCATSEQGKLWCWGRGAYGQLGYDSSETIGDNETPATVGWAVSDERIGQVTVGFDHTCLHWIDGQMQCWGRGWHGQLGNAHIGDVFIPELPVDIGEPVSQVATGKEHNCVLLAQGGVRCWGYGGAGRLGYGNVDTLGDDEVPSQLPNVPVLGTVEQVAAGAEHTCVILEGGQVQCWGKGYYGQLGYGNTDNRGDDELPSGIVDVGGVVVQLAAGGNHTCALLEEGKVRCWGYGAYGQLGYGEIENVGDNELPETAGDVDIGGIVVAIAAGENHSCALLDQGQVRCWGDGRHGQLGYGNVNNVGDNEFPTTAGDIEVF